MYGIMLSTYDITLYVTIGSLASCIVQKIGLSDYNFATHYPAVFIYSFNTALVCYTNKSIMELFALPLLFNYENPGKSQCCHHVKVKKTGTNKS